MSKILITGAAGFIGSQLAYKLWRLNNDVVLLDNFSYGKEDNLIFKDKDFRNEILREDICDRPMLDKLFQIQNFDYIYHIAAITPLPDCQINPGKAVEVNVAGTVNILDMARKYGVKKVVFSSTSAVYENCHKFPTAENDVLPPHLIYSLGKFTAEKFCQSYCDVYGMNVTVLRFANVYGPHIDCLRKQPPVAGYLIRELFHDRQPILHSTGEQRRDFIYVDDLIDLAIKVQQGSGFDCVNVSSNETHSINEMFDIIAHIMQKSHIKAQYTNSLNYWKNYPELYNGAYPISEKILDNEVCKHTECDNSHAFQKYAWKPMVDFTEGLKKTVEFALNALQQE